MNARSVRRDPKEIEEMLEYIEKRRIKLLEKWRRNELELEEDIVPIIDEEICRNDESAISPTNQQVPIKNWQA
jgi:hypothetical protein